MQVLGSKLFTRFFELRDFIPSKLVTESHTTVATLMEIRVLRGK